MDGDKIEICTEVGKRIANILKDPTNGKDMPAEERNRKRAEAHDDIITCIEVLAAFASSADGLLDIMQLREKYK